MTWKKGHLPMKRMERTRMLNRAEVLQRGQEGEVGGGGGNTASARQALGRLPATHTRRNVLTPPNQPLSLERVGLKPTAVRDLPLSVLHPRASPPLSLSLSRSRSLSPPLSPPLTWGAARMDGCPPSLHTYTRAQLARSNSCGVCTSHTSSPLHPHSRPAHQQPLKARPPPQTPPPPSSSLSLSLSTPPPLPSSDDESTQVFSTQFISGMHVDESEVLYNYKNITDTCTVLVCIRILSLCVRALLPLSVLSVSLSLSL
jgi:hypothetical protein